MRSRLAVLATVLTLGVGGSPATAAGHPLLYVPNPPPVPAGPVTAALGNAYRAVVGAPAGPNGVAAYAAYLRALQAAARGDRSGALAAAADAQARSLAFPPLPAAPVAAGPTLDANGTPAARAVPIVSAGAASDPDLGSAANEIEIAREAGRSGPALDRATAHYRAALAAFYDGDARTTAREARAALDAATDAIVGT